MTNDSWPWEGHRCYAEWQKAAIAAWCIETLNRNETTYLYAFTRPLYFPPVSAEGRVVAELCRGSKAWTCSSTTRTNSGGGSWCAFTHSYCSLALYIHAVIIEFIVVQSTNPVQ